MRDEEALRTGATLPTSWVTCTQALKSTICVIWRSYGRSRNAPESRGDRESFHIRWFAPLKGKDVANARMQRYIGWTLKSAEEED